MAELFRVRYFCFWEPESVEGGVLSGQTLHYQYWFRDNPHGVCTAEFNTTNALTINWH